MSDRRRHASLSSKLGVPAALSRNSRRAAVRAAAKQIRVSICSTDSLGETNVERLSRGHICYHQFNVVMFLILGKSTHMINDRCRFSMKQVVAASTEASKTPIAKAEKPMNIVFVSTEVSPWSKTGGLGDVVGSLPEELVKRGHKVMSVSPRYDQYKGAWDTNVTTNILGEDVRFFHEKKKGVDRVFVDTPLFLAKVWGKTGSKLYGKKSGADFIDNQKRFAVLNHAAFEASKLLPFG